jgi:glycopeptide antibiotics resistance protein
MEKLLKLSTAIFSKLTFTNTYIPIDKQMHFLSGLIGSLVLSFVIGYWASVVISIAAALKEWYDYRHPTIHTADFFDWLATTLGGLLGAVIYYVWI